MAVFALRLGILSLLAPSRPDAANFVAAGRHVVFAPGELYSAAARALARTGTLPVPGHGFLYPPAAAWLAAPFGLLPAAARVPAWTLADAVAALAALGLLYGVVKPRGLGRPLFWLVAAYFPPLFAEIDAGQIGGFILLAAVLSMRLAPTRPRLAGAVGGLAGAVKIYPAALALASGRRDYWAALAASAAAVSALAFLPLGSSGAAFYVRQVLFPATLKARYQDCAIDSVKTLYSRTVGGDVYYLPAPHGLTAVHAPWDAPALATALMWLTLAALVAGCVWAGRRSQWHPAYGLALGFGLGALVPAEVNPYQFLPLLPLLLLVLRQALEARRYWVPAVLGVILLGFLRQPCDLPFPNLWTVAGVAMYVVAVSQASLFRGAGGGGKHGDQRSGPVSLGGSRHVARD